MGITYILLRPNGYNWDCYQCTSKGLFYLSFDNWSRSDYCNITDLSYAYTYFKVIDISWA